MDVECIIDEIEMAKSVHNWKAICLKKDFNAALRNGLGRIAFVLKKYADADRWYGDVVARFGDSHLAPEAMYWRAVAHYKATNDHTVLGKVAEELRSTYPSSLWASKAIPWLH